MLYKNRPLFGEFITQKIGKVCFSIAFAMFIAMAGIQKETPEWLITIGAIPLSG